MRIAQIAPLAEAVPPRFYGGTERVVHWLTEELVRRGHEVTLFATADSRTSAELVPCAPEGLRLAGIKDCVGSHLVMLETVRKRADEFDILHFHVDLLQHLLFRGLASKCVSTVHGRLDLPDSRPVFRAFPEMPLVSISTSQRAPLPPGTNWLATIHHGLPPESYPLNAKGGDYLAFLGRISREKRPDRAIAIAKKTGRRLKIAAKVDASDQTYFEEEIEPLLDDPLIEFIGEIGDEEKSEFLGSALALILPIDWPEPFGLVMIEAMANGTPVIAWDRGSAREVIAPGVSGVIVNSLEEAASAVEAVRMIDRRGVRRHFDDHFTVARMASRYEEAYAALLSRAPASAAGLGTPVTAAIGAIGPVNRPIGHPQPNPKADCPPLQQG